jgi:isoleucyl-tRNA synthetase
VAQADFRNDVMYSRGHLNQLGESYRKIRNTARFLLGNLFDFSGGGEPEDLLDKYLAARTRDFLHRVRQAYDSYEFHLVFKAVLDFCTTDLSALYCDVRKDRLYCDAAGAPTRRAAQRVISDALHAITVTMAPILSFTAEEIWAHFGKKESVHLELLPEGAPMDAGIKSAMDPYLELRSQVQAALEPFRAQKKSSLDAHVTVPRMDADPAWLADLFIVSKVSFGDAISVTDAGGHKCERCWKWQDETPLCARCQSAVKT